MSSPLGTAGPPVSLPVSREADAETQTGRHNEGRGVRSDVGRASVVVIRQQYGGSYCFEDVARAAEAAAAAVEQQHRGRIGPGRDVHGTGECAGVALPAAGVADQFADCAQRRKVLAPALGPRLLVLDRVPGEEDEDEADEL